MRPIGRFLLFCPEWMHLNFLIINGFILDVFVVGEDSFNHFVFFLFQLLCFFHRITPTTIFSFLHFQQIIVFQLHQLRCLSFGKLNQLLRILHFLRSMVLQNVFNNGRFLSRKRQTANQ